MIARNLVFTALLLLANGFFVAVEFALVRARRTRLEAMARTGDRLARIALEATGNLPGLLHDAGWIEHERGAAVVVAFSDQLANDGDGAAALAAIGEAVWQWLSAADQPDDIPT